LINLEGKDQSRAALRLSTFMVGKLFDEALGKSSMENYEGGKKNGRKEMAEANE